MKTPRLVDFAQERIRVSCKSAKTAVDATVGNAHDTTFLAELVGSEGQVYGFDVQEIALETAKMVLETRKLQDRITLFFAGHETMDEYLPESLLGHLDLAMFNLGYLPHGDKSLTTQPSSTLKALQLSWSYLKAGGVLSILAYRGHSGGIEEFNNVRDWVTQHRSHCAHITEQDSHHPEHKGPFWWMLTKN